VAIINKNGKYKVVIYLGKDSNGKEIRKYKTFEKLKDAKEWEKKAFSRDESSNLLSSKILVSEGVSLFLDFIKEEFKGNTYVGYKSDLEGKFSKYFEFWQLNNITSLDLERFRTSLKGTGLATASINRVMASVKSFFDWAVNNPNSRIDLKASPAKGLKAVKNTSSEQLVKYWNEAEVELFLKEIEANPYKDLFVFLLNTGLRINEALGLTVDRFVASNGILNVSQQLDEYVAKKDEPEIKRAFVISSLKTSTPRKIALNSMATEILARKCKGKKSTDFIFETTRKRSDEKRPVVFKRGPRPEVLDCYCISYMNFSKDVFLPIVRKIGLKNIGLHGLRHTFASHFMMNGGDLFVLSKILGHKSIKTTEIYAHLSNAFMAESRSLVSFGDKK
jgi:site-specific recombinase XerD